MYGGQNINQTNKKYKIPDGTPICPPRPFWPPSGYFFIGVKMNSPQKEHGYTAIANSIMDAFVYTNIAGEARQVLDFIIRKTYGYNKKSDYIALSQFVAATRMSKPSVCRALRRLVKMNIIVKIDNDTGFLYSFNKHFATWKPLTKPSTLSKTTTNVVKIDNKSLSKMSHTKDIITKDIKTNVFKDTESATALAIKPEPVIPEQTKLIENFKTLYEQETKLPFHYNAKDFIVAAKLIKTFGYDMVANKAKVLAVLCKNQSVWFTKGGWADFGIGKLSTHWNEVIPEQMFDKEKLEREKITAKVREENERINRAIHDYGNRKH